MIKACIFDLDGTLAYTLDSMACVANEVMERFSLKPQPVENFKYYCGNGADTLIRRCLADAGDEKLEHYSLSRSPIIPIPFTISTFLPTGNHYSYSKNKVCFTCF